MANKKIGITGYNGFIGWHLIHTIKYIYPEDFQLIKFHRDYFLNPNSLDDFVSNCDYIVHLAGMNRDIEESKINKVNIGLSKALTASFKRVSFKGKLIFSSTSQEENQSIYGTSKKESREIFIDSSKQVGFHFTGLIIPNVFGPFCKPNYNSFIATFCDKITNDIMPKIIVDNDVELIYVGNLVDQIIDCIKSAPKSNKKLKSDQIIRVSMIFEQLISFHEKYIKKGNIPSLDNPFDLQLFNTYRSYLNIKNIYPVNHNKNSDERGDFSEIIKTQSGGQFSYSTTYSNFTRGNHFHTRKVERFSVIQGNALIQLRKIGSNTVHDFKLNGDTPSFIDIPIWYTHNIKNIGNEPLITLFWINEPYNEKDPDTYFEIV